MTAHSTGTGSSWNETLDVDQPHGLDFQEWQDVRIGVRKRIAEEHSTFADSTVGGIHKPGGSAILGIDDDTVTVVADGTYRGHGIVWDGSVNLWCWTKTAGATDAPGVAGTEDWTILKMHPDKQWGGQDVTWQGDHAFVSSICVAGQAYFDQSMDISGPVSCSHDITVNGKLHAVTRVNCDGDMSIDGTSDFGGDVAFNSDISVDGNAAFGEDISVDATAVFGAKVAIEGDASGPQFPAAWASFCGDGGAGDLGAGDFTGYNVNVVTRISEGIYEISFSDALAHADYMVTALAHRDTASAVDGRAGMVCTSTATD
ncbi:MAG: hypothetical protein KAS32_17040, partial [Candidatus Peribacteraceae bacterium]|nr:hypothetical protein [Candidatus Peribacteraceae bacterium]